MEGLWSYRRVSSLQLVWVGVRVCVGGGGGCGAALNAGWATQSGRVVTGILASAAWCGGGVN
jgi:hypothetical protein